MKDDTKIKPIRAFAPTDIPQVADMFQRLLLSEGASRRKLQPEALPDYFKRIFFDNPWYDEQIPSLVYEGSNGRIIGFLGVVPRRMVLEDRPIRLAISFHFMVESESRSSLAGVQLLRAFFSGPQDMSLTDGAGEVGRRVWEGVGGKTALLYSQNWTRILRPTRYFAGLAARNSKFSLLARGLSPFCSLADAAASRLLPRYFPNPAAPAAEEEPEIETLLDYLPQFTIPWAIRPDYDERSLRWLLEEAAEMKYFGEFKKALVRNSQGEVIGWFMYYLKPGETSTVFHFAAKKKAVGEVIDSLFSHAWQNGSAAVTGRVNPHYMQELADRRSYFNRDGTLVLIHSNNTELLNIVYRGDAFLTGLEGEWSLLF